MERVCGGKGGREGCEGVGAGVARERKGKHSKRGKSYLKERTMKRGRWDFQTRGI